MPPNAKVGLVEDNPDTQELMVASLNRAGHLLVFFAASEEAAHSGIESGEADGVEVWLIDSDLGKGHGAGARVVKRLRQKFNDEKRILGISLLEEGVEGADEQMPKLDTDRIAKRITEL